MEDNVIMNGVGSGSMAQRLMDSNFDPMVMKLWRGNDGRAYRNARVVDNQGNFTVNEDGTPKYRAQVVHNATALLRKDEWLQIDRAVIEAFQTRIRLADDLVSRGLTYQLSDGLGTTVLQTQAQSDLQPAQVSMTGLQRTDNDKLQWDLTNLPLPITHKDFQIPIRMLNASRKYGQPLDTSQVALAGRQLAESIEETVAGTASNFSFAGGTIYGYQDYPDRQTVSLAANWTSGTGADILTDTITMLTAAKDDARAYGPYVLYVAGDIGLHLENDFKAASDKTIRNRLLEIENVDSIVTADYLTNGNVILAQMTSDTVRMVIGMQPTTLQWETDGGWLTNLKVATIMVPQIRSDFYGRCGIVHGS